MWGCNVETTWRSMRRSMRSRRARARGAPIPIDVHVGGRVRFRRMLLGMSQEKLGEKLGLTFQQVQKYEKGINRIGASRLFDLAQVLGVSVQFFYEEAPAGGWSAAAARPGSARSRPKARSSSSCAAATAWSSTRPSCASPTPRRGAPSSIWSAAWPTTTLRLTRARRWAVPESHRMPNGAALRLVSAVRCASS